MFFAWQSLFTVSSHATWAAGSAEIIFHSAYGIMLAMMCSTPASSIDHVSR